MVETKINVANFKPFKASTRKAAIRDDQISISKFRVTLPIALANKVGQTVNLLFSDPDKSLAIQKSASGPFKLQQIHTTKSSRSIYCKALLEAKKIKKGRYTVQWDEKDQMIVAKVA
jgi:hypothetical protein